MSPLSRATIRVVLVVVLATAGFLGLQLQSASVSDPNQVTETVTVTTTLTSINVTEIQWTTMTVPTYEISTLTVPTYERSTLALTETSRTTSVVETTTTHVSSVPYPEYFVTTIANKTVLRDVILPSQTSLQIGLVAFFLVGVAFGLVTVVGYRRKEGELMGGLMAGLGFVLWAIIQFLGGFPSESAELGFGGTFGYVWQSLIVVVTGLLSVLFLGLYLRREKTKGG
jgi:hypothetical protein